MPRRAFHLAMSKKNAAPDVTACTKTGAGPAIERRHTQQIAGSNIPHGDLATVAGVHVDAQQTPHDDGQSLGVRFRIDGLAGWEFDDPSAADQRLNRVGRSRRPRSAL